MAMISPFFIQSETIVGQLVLGDIMKDLSGQGLFYFFHLADVGGR